MGKFTPTEHHILFYIALSQFRAYITRAMTSILGKTGKGFHLFEQIRQFHTDVAHSLAIQFSRDPEP
jgi:hypothetical protein